VTRPELLRSPAAMILAAATALIATGPAAAEGVGGIDRMLCTVQQVSICAPFADCMPGSPLDWDLPDFVVIDVAAKTLSTTAASERPRASAVRHLERDHGHLFLQGVENKRAFSIVIVEETGELSAAVSMADLNLSIYGVCTPMPVERPAGG
jgi:hypothetical protein